MIKIKQSKIFSLLDIRFNNRKFRVQQPIQPDSSSETESSDYTLQVRQTSSTSSSDGEESECGAASRAQYKSGYKRRLKTGNRSWSANLSARSNQDNQREFEEKAMKQVIIKLRFPKQLKLNKIQ